MLSIYHWSEIVEWAERLCLTDLRDLIEALTELLEGTTHDPMEH